MAGTDLNSVVLIGRLTRDAELSYLQSGSAVAKMSIATNRNKKEGEQWVGVVDYFDISLFGKQAEVLKQYLLKGKQIAVQGNLRQDRWEKDGQKFSKVYVVASNVELLGGRSDSSGGSGGYTPRASYNAKPNAGAESYGTMQESPESFGGDALSEFSEDIPF